MKKARRVLADFVFFSLGVLSASFGLGGFLLPNSFIDGGVVGVSLILVELTGFAVGPLLVLINLPFLALGLSQIGKEFAIKSIFAILGLALCVHYLEFPTVTSDKLLVAAFGGFFLGAGIGLAIRGGAVIDGSEVLAIYLSRKTGISIGDIVLIFNVLVFATGGYVLSIETALYAILTYFAASRTVDFIIRGVEEYTGVTIISKKSHELRKMITLKMGRGATTYKGTGGYSAGEESPKDYDILYTVLTRLEVARLQAEIDAIDESAFVIMSSIKDTRGGMIKRRSL